MKSKTVQWYTADVVKNSAAANTADQSSNLLQIHYVDSLNSLGWRRL